jgi:hypothetical protein
VAKAFYGVDREAISPHRADRDVKQVIADVE